jgi:uncharacterized membrane protein
VRAWLGGTLVVYFLATAIVLYVTWSVVGGTTIAGMHGRYFTLVLILAVPALAGAGGRRLRISERTLAGCVMVITAVSACAMFAFASHHYYNQAPWQAVPRIATVLF